MDFKSNEGVREEGYNKFHYEPFSEARREIMENLQMQSQSQRRTECLPGQLPGLCIEEEGLLDGVKDEIKSPWSEDYTKPGMYRFGEQRYTVMNDGTQVFESKNGMLIVAGDKLTTVGNVKIEDVTLEVYGMNSHGKKVTFENGSVAIVQDGYIVAVGDERSRRAIRYLPREVQKRQ